MKLEAWEAILSILEAGGTFQNGRYELTNNNGKLHRHGGPAVVCLDGRRYWYQNGQRHRDDGPAEVYPDGSQYWYRNGLIHRDDGPAITYSDGTQHWYQYGKCFGGR